MGNNINIGDLDLPQDSSQINMPTLYIFGIDSVTKKEKIIGFDSTQKKFFTKKIPQGLKIWNYTSPLYLSEKCIMISGGINQGMNQIQNELYYYNPKQNKAMKLANMSQKRYTHMSVFHKNKYYVFGGRFYGSDNVAIMNDVEAFNITTGKWEICAAMLKSRCTGQVVIYNDYIYVFGGYTSQYKRSRCLERYDPVMNTWISMDLKMDIGIECTYVMAGPHAGDFTCFGGNFMSGRSTSVRTYNIANRTIHSKLGALVKQRILLKGFAANGNVFIFGGDDQKSCEECNIQQRIFSIKQYAGENHIKGMGKDFSHTTQPITINYQGQPRNDIQTKLFKVIQIIKKYLQIWNLPCPWDIELAEYQSGTRLSDGRIFISGGFKSSQKFILDRAYILNPNNMMVQDCGKMFDGRFAHGTIQKGDYVYAIGGNSYGKGPESTMNFCERFNLQLNKWEQIGNLNESRCAMVIQNWNGQIMIAGGFNGKKQMNTIEVFNEQQRKWEKMGLMLVEPVESMCSFQANENELIILGGKTSDNLDTNKIWKYTIIQECIDASHGEQVGKMSQQRSLLTCMQFDQNTLLIVGGHEVNFDFVDLKTMQSNTGQNYIAIQNKLINELAAQGIAKFPFKKNLVVPLKL